MKRTGIHILLLYCWLGAAACQNKGAGREAGKDAATAQPVAAMPPAADEAQFDAFFDAFCEAVRQNDKKRLGSMLYFPFQTGSQWRNDDLPHMDAAKNETFNQVSEKEFGQYCDGIFHADVRRLLPQADGDALAEVDDSTKENYYLTLRRHTDPHSKMYEVYVQFAEEGRSTESYFGFVFGKVNGQYKAVSYFGKWPVKG